MNRALSPRAMAAVLGVTLASCVAVLILLTGCGGGDWPDEPEATATKPATPNCAQPGVCT